MVTTRSVSAPEPQTHDTSATNGRDATATNARAAITARGLLARIAYGAAFLLGVPLLLAWWAHATSNVVPLPALHAPLAGGSLAAAGILLMSAGMLTLALRGGGLPMNAFPPTQYVTTGVYRWLSQPIYVGFAAAVLGASIAAGSASGLWLVTPVTALCAAALVLGYEQHDLRRRFGEVHRPLLSLPRGDAVMFAGSPHTDTLRHSAAAPPHNGTLPPTRSERFAVFVLVLVPWLVIYEAVHQLGVPRDAIDVRFAFERTWPVWQWTELIYVTAYVVVPGAVLLAPTRSSLRRFAVLGLIATAAVTLVYLVVPFISPPRHFLATSVPGRLLALEQRMSSTVAAFPAFHVIWACIAAVTLRARGRAWARAALVWALLLAASCVTTGMHSLLDVVAAFVTFGVLTRYDVIWRALLRAAQRIANSWREWRYGRIRIINHGMYAGAGGAVGVWIAALTTGDVGSVLVVAFAALVGAGLWAQWLEGSSALLRPFGYYGGIAGGVLAALALSLTGAPTLLLLAGFALGAPLVQACGRVRCLVQGCCHGAPAPAAHGIRYLHDRSRVSQIAHLRGVPVYPTPLYSIVSNLVVAVLLVRLYTLGAAPSIILGLYFILNGISRFVEESYRGEPQTPVVGGLRIYQWLALLSVLGGIGATTLAPAHWPRPLALHSPAAVTAALLFGVAATLAMGVDFPRSSRRFSRLAAVESRSIRSA